MNSKMTVFFATQDNPNVKSLLEKINKVKLHPGAIIFLTEKEMDVFRLRKIIPFEIPYGPPPVQAEPIGAKQVEPPPKEGEAPSNVVEFPMKEPTQGQPAPDTSPESPASE